MNPTKLSDLTGPPQVRALVYGGPGVGKTVFAGGSQTKRTLVVDIDIGSTSLHYFPGIRKDLVSVVQVRSAQALSDVVVKLAAAPSAYDLVVIDTLSEFQQIYIGEICKSLKIDVPDQRAWGCILSFMSGLIRQMAQIPIDQIFVAHETVGLDEQTKRQMFKPSFQGAFGAQYARHLDLIMRYLLVEKRVEDAIDKTKTHTVIERYLQCQRDPYSHAKDRFSALAMYEWPVVDDLFDKIRRSSQE